MRSRPFALFPLLGLVGCSVLVQIDEDDYSGEYGATGGNASTGDGDGDLGGSGDGDSGGTGGAGDGDGDSGGTGGLVELPEPDHYYALDGDMLDSGSNPAEYHPQATASTGSYVSGAISGQAWEIGFDQWLALEPKIAETSPFTISFWFAMNADLTTQYFNLISKVNPNTADGGFTIYSQDYYINARLGNSADSDEGSPAIHSQDGSWNHLVVVFEEFVNGQQDHLSVYLNGEAAIDQTKTLPDLLTSTAYIRFGTQEVNPSFQGFQGSIDEIRVYNQRLSPEQIRLLYEQDAP